MIAAALAALALVVAPLESPPLVDLSTTAVASSPAVRLDVPARAEDIPPAVGSSASANGRCVGWEPLLEQYSPGWDIARMSKIAYRESRCQPEVRNSSSSATGLLQILSSHCPWIARQMGTWCTRARLNDAEFNVTAAAVMWDEQGYAAWSTS